MSEEPRFSVWRVTRGLAVGVGIAICIVGPSIVPGRSAESSAYRFAFVGVGAVFVLFGMLLIRLANRGSKGP